VFRRVRAAARTSQPTETDRAPTALDGGPMEDHARNLKDMKAVYTVIDRGQGKSFWVRIGVGFTNRDGSINLRLDAIPVNGTLQVREWSDPFERRGDVGDAPARTRGGSRGATPDALIEG
jgi:hypothetical protein